MADPSPQRLRRAEERGVVAASQRLSASASIAAALALAGLCVATTRRTFDSALTRALDAAASPEAPDLAGAATFALAGVARALAPIVAAALVALALTHALQTRFAFTLQREQDSGDQGRSELVVRALWGIALAAAGVGALWAHANATGIAHRSVAELAVALPGLLVGVAWRVLAAALVAGAIELAWRRRVLRRALTPTATEQKRELRDEQGDAHVRHRARELGTGALENNTPAKAP